MSVGFAVSGRVGRPVAEVFDAVVNPRKLSGYFTTLGGASAPLVTGTTVTWWGNSPVEVDEVVPNRRIVLRWDGSGPDEKLPYKTRIEMNFEPLDDGGTLVRIAEEGWRDDEAGRKASYGNCEGWAMMLSCMKAYVEHGINLREGFYPSEMRGELPTSQNK
ncbi:MAG: SRPBCC domain-containing protein [Pseudaminobacter sp.]|nr:SRPBCC domain-containing protein [Pseudaminobacter sp.]